MKTIVVNNPNRSRKFGWGYNTSPSQNEKGWYFEPPIKPDYVGTINQVLTAIQNDRNLASVCIGNTLYSTAWFYDGCIIESPRTWLEDYQTDVYLGHTPKSITLEVTGN